MRTRLRWMLATLLIWASFPGPANAHLVNSGLGPFYDGIAHLFVTPEDILAVVAFALLAGLGGKQVGSSVLFLLPLAWMTGALVGQMTPIVAGLPVLSAVILIALGALVAWDRRLPLQFVGVFALAVGLLLGYFNGSALAVANSGGLAVVGIACAVFVVVAIVAGQVASLQKAWTRITVRVAGSWIGAIGLLTLGWTFR